MQKHNNIKAIFFLGMFSLLLLQNIAPHTHHLHEVEHSHKDVAHNVGHTHDVPKEENSKKGLLDLFFQAHTHSVVSNEILITHESSVKQLNIKKDIKTPVSVNHYRTSTNYDEAEKVTVYHPPKYYYFNYDLSFLYSRGPPTLG